MVKRYSRKSTKRQYKVSKKRSRKNSRKRSKQNSRKNLRKRKSNKVIKRKKNTQNPSKKRTEMLGGREKGLTRRQIRRYYRGQERYFKEQAEQRKKILEQYVSDYFKDPSVPVTLGNKEDARIHLRDIMEDYPEENFNKDFNYFWDKLANQRAAAIAATLRALRRQQQLESERNNIIIDPNYNIND